VGVFSTTTGSGSGVFSLITIGSGSGVFSITRSSSYSGGFETIGSSSSSCSSPATLFFTCRLIASCSGSGDFA